MKLLHLCHDTVVQVHVTNRGATMSVPEGASPSAIYSESIEPL